MAMIIVDAGLNRGASIFSIIKKKANTAESTAQDFCGNTEEFLALFVQEIFAPQSVILGHVVMPVSDNFFRRNAVLQFLNG